MATNLANKKRVALRMPEAATKYGRNWIVVSHGQAFQNYFDVHEVLHRVSKNSDLDTALSQSTANSLWIVANESWTEKLLKATTRHSLQNRSKSLGDLILCEAPRHEVLPCLHSLFRRVVGEVPSFKMLRQELAEALASENRGQLFIGGIVDVESGILTLARGDLQTLTVPLSFFLPTPDCEPDFAKFDLVDYGQTIRFGDYEASAHSVLYEFDPEYRREVNKQRTAEEKGFGPSLKRLRLSRGLRQDEIPGVSPKTIARIEQSKTGKPQAETLNRIAKAFGITPEQIEDY